MTDSDSGGSYRCDGSHTCPGYTYNSTEVANNNDACGKCSSVSYQVPVDQSSRLYVNYARVVLYVQGDIPLLCCCYIPHRVVN